MLRRILLLCLLSATSTLSHAQDADWFYLQGDKDTVKLLWAPHEWSREVQGFNVKRRVPGGTWQTLNSRPILPTYFPEDIETRTNDAALREELRKFHERVAASQPPKPLPTVLSELTNQDKYRDTRDTVLGAYRQALLFGFAYQDANVPKGLHYEYALYPVMSGGVERDLPMAVRRWKWGSVPSLVIPFGKGTLAPNTVESTMRITWPVEHEVLERNLVRHVRIYYVNPEGKKTLWTRKGIDPVKYLHHIHVDLKGGLGEPRPLLFTAVPVNYFDLEGTPTPPVSYDWDKHRDTVMNPGPAVTSDTSDKPAPPPPSPPSPPRVMSTSARITQMVDANSFYPAESRRRGEQGAPVVRACVGPSGALLGEPVITENSGFPDLDAAAIRVAKAMRYAPGRDGGVPAQESCIKFKVKFSQSSNEAAAPSQEPSRPAPPETSSSASTDTAVDPSALLGTASLWLDASSGISLDQGRVAAWRDKSGNGFIATMKDPQRRPTVEPMGNGVPAVHFDGRQSLHLERPLEIGAGTLFIVGRNGGDFARNIILGPVGSNDNNQLRWESPEAAMIVGPNHGSRIVQMPVGDTTLLHVLAVLFDGQRVGFWHNGQPSNVFVFPKPPGKAYSFNSIGSFFSQMYLTGDIAAMVYLRNTLTRSEIEVVDRHLRELYGVR